MSKTIIISITAIICTLLICFTALYINYITTNYSIIGNFTMGDSLVLKDLKTGDVYIKENNGFWELYASFNN